MAKRRSLSKKVRFEVFKRDSYTCQYCGGHPPQSILHVDHIVPVSKGGGNEIDNLVTACGDCNQGKAATPLTVIPESLAEKAERTKEEEAQLQGYTEVMQAKREREKDHAWKVADIFVDHFGENEIRKDWFTSIKRFNERLGVFEVMDSMESAVSKKSGSMNSCFKYFCGICWSKVREAENG